MKNQKSQSIDRSQAQNRTPSVNNNSSVQRVQSGNKSTISHQKAVSNTEFNWAPTTVKPNPLGLKPPQQRNAHVLNVGSAQRNTSSSVKRELSSNSQRSNGMISPQKTPNKSINAPIQIRIANGSNIQVRKISENIESSNRAGSAIKNNSGMVKQNSLSDLQKNETIEEQRQKMEHQQNAKNVRQIRAQQQVNQPRMMSDTNLNASANYSKTLDVSDQDNDIKSLTDLNEIDEVYEGIETPMNQAVKGMQKTHKESEGFGEQEELVKAINEMQEKKNEKQSEEEARKLEQKKEQLRQIREKQLKELINPVEEEKTLQITFLRNEMNFRTILRDKFSKNKYTNIDITFEDDEIQLTDCVLFEQQNDSLRQLTLQFHNASSFNEETLGAIKYIKLRKLQNLILNFARTKHTKQLINYSIFNLAYIPRVEINFSPHDQLIYIKEDIFIPIDFSNFQIGVRDLQKLNRHLNEFQTNHLRFLLQENTYLSTATENSNLIRNPNKRRTQTRRQSQLYQQPHQMKVITPIHQITNLPNEKILYEIGHIFAKLKHIKISFKNCNLAEADLHSFVLGLLETNATENGQQVGVFGNNFLESIEINIEGNHAIQEGFFTMFKPQNFKKLQKFTLIFDKTNQILKQYEQFNAFHFVQYLKHINNVKFITNFDQIVYEHYLPYNKVYLSISYLDISPFQLVDIQKVLNIYKTTVDLTLDLSNNYKLPYKIFKSFLNELQCLKTSLKKLHLNLINTNITELEFICLYMTVSNITNLTVKYDIELSNLFRVTDSYSRLFLHHLGETILDKDMFKLKFTYLFNQLKQNPYQFTSATINFYYNYSLTPELFEEQFKPFLQHHTELTSLTLDFNYCCYEPDQVLTMMTTVLTAIQSNQTQPKPFNLIKLSFINNHQVPLDQLTAIFKKFLVQIPQLNSLVLVTDQYTLEKLNKKSEMFYQINVHPAQLKVNKLSDIKLVAKKLYVAKKIAPEKFKDEPDQDDENADDDEMTQSQMILPKIFDLNVPPRVKKVISYVVKPAAIVTYDPENTTITQATLQKNVKDLAKNHPYEQIFVLQEAYATDLEETHAAKKKKK